MSLAGAIAFLLYVAAVLRAEGWFTSADLADALALVAAGLAVTLLGGLSIGRHRD